MEVDAAILGVRYDSQKEVFTIGGYTKFEPTIQNIVDAYLGDGVTVNVKYIQKNKLQYVVSHVKRGVAFAAFNEMKRAGLTLAPTTSFHKLMR
jgi:hypothetical protein